MKKILVVMTAMLLVIAMSVPVFAEKYDGTNPIGDAFGDGATTTTFDKYLVMKKSATVPYADFLYTVSSDGATSTTPTNEEVYPQVLIPATAAGSDTTPVVWKGVRPDKVKVIVGTSESAAKNKLVFTPADGTTDGEYRVGKGDIATSGEKYVKKQFTLDFSEIHFAEPGVYRYYVQESNGTTADGCQYGDMGIEYDVNVSDTGKKNWRTVDVYVVDSDTGDYSSATSDGQLSIADYVWYEGKLTTNDKPNHTAGATSQNAWKVTWTDASDNTKTYEYISNNEWAVKENGTKTGEVKEPPANATGSVTIDGKSYTTWSAAKAAMKAFDTKTLTPNGAEAGAKSSEFVNKYGTADLEFGKKVIGNQGSRDQWFEFKLTLVSNDPTNKPLENNTLFEVNVGSHTTTNPNNANDFFNPTSNSATSYTAGSMKTANTVAQGQATGEVSGSATTEFDATGNTAGTNKLKVASNKIEWTLYLQHGQYVQVKGIPYGVKYTVAETDAATGYKKTNGTDIEPGVIDGEDITNAHMDPLEAVIGNKATKTYVKDNAGMMGKDGNNFIPLYQGTGTNANKVYTDTNLSNEYTGDRYSEDENVYTGVTNKRSGVIPTGIIMSVMGGAALVLVALGFLVMINRRKRAYDYD